MEPPDAHTAPKESQWRARKARPPRSRFLPPGAPQVPRSREMLLPSWCQGRSFLPCPRKATEVTMKTGRPVTLLYQTFFFLNNPLSQIASDPQNILVVKGRLGGVYLMYGETGACQRSHPVKSHTASKSGPGPSPTTSQPCDAGSARPCSSERPLPVQERTCALRTT